LSLTGNLEDLPLLDIIQIVSFSKKTGYLTIRREHGEAAIVFQDGNVVAAFTPESPPPDPRAASLAPEQRRKLARSRIEIALEQLIRLRDGQFLFSLTDQPPERLGQRDLSLETLPGGINAQELLLDLARGMDEDRRDSSAALEASFAETPEEPLVEEGAAPASEAGAALADAAPGQDVAPDAAEAGEPAALPAAPAPQVDVPATGSAAGEPEPAEVRNILLVDDEEDVRRVLSDRFDEAGYQVVEAEDPEAAVKKGGRLGKADVPFLLVTDLGMPTSGGSSFQGGFEVVKRLAKMGLRPPVLMMTDSYDRAIKARARQMAVTSLVFKPGLSKLDPQQFEADLRAFADKLLRDVLPELSRRGRPAPANAGAAGSARAAGPPLSEEASRQLRMLEQRLEQLRGAVDPGQISSLVMSVAREFFERAALFLVKNEQVRGLGGFGQAPRDQTLGLAVREVAIPLSEPSVFLDVVSRRTPFYGPLPAGRWSDYLIGCLGRFRSHSAALLPLIAHRDAIAVLYGDNPDSGRAVGRLEALEVFIQQAGAALENAFLQRKLQALHGQDATTAVS
jgi:CheY-like chemotaxis protein